MLYRWHCEGCHMFTFDGTWILQNLRTIVKNFKWFFVTYAGNRPSIERYCEFSTNYETARHQTYPNTGNNITMPLNISLFALGLTLILIRRTGNVLFMVCKYTNFTDYRTVSPKSTYDAYAYGIKSTCIIFMLIIEVKWNYSYFRQWSQREKGQRLSYTFWQI